MSQQPTIQDEILARIVSSEAMKQVTQEEYYELMGQLYYLLKDEETMKMMRDDPDLAPLIPSVSHLLRTASIEDKKVRERMKIRWRRQLRIQLMVNKTPDLVSQAKFDAWRNFGEAAIEDTNRGWRGRLATERIRSYKIESGAPQKRGFLRRILG